MNARSKQHAYNQKRRLYQLYGGHCFYCLREIEERSDNNTRDHLIPKARGGTNKIDNLVLACKPCNNERGCKQAVRYLLRWCASLTINRALLIVSSQPDRLHFHNERLKRKAGR